MRRTDSKSLVQETEQARGDGTLSMCIGAKCWCYKTCKNSTKDCMHDLATGFWTKYKNEDGYCKQARERVVYHDPLKKKKSKT